MKLEHLAQMRALEHTYNAANGWLIDASMKPADGSVARGELPLKRIQFDALEVLASELEKVCTLLDCSKREFLEAAVADAITSAMSAYRQTLDRVREDEGGVQKALLTTYEG